jgi:hypothetical protein
VKLEAKPKKKKKSMKMNFSMHGKKSNDMNFQKIKKNSDL